MSYLVFILLLIVSAIFCYILFVIDNVQFQASCDRAHLLTAQAPTMSLSEAKHLVYALDVCWRRPRLELTDRTALNIALENEDTIVIHQTNGQKTLFLSVMTLYETVDYKSCLYGPSNGV